MLKIVAGLLFLVAGAVWVWAWPRSHSPATLQVEAASMPAEQIHYICRETGRISQGPRVETPAINRETGRATLIQALHCKTCQRWLPAPPSLAMASQAQGPRCPIHATPLTETAEGP
jgi:hypothetical protein